jgi:hypothetical protein
LAKKDDGTILVPTRDISLFWAADMLRPATLDLESEGSSALFLHLEEGPESVPPWFFHQQCRLLQSGANFKMATTTKFDIQQGFSSEGLKNNVMMAIVAGLFTHPTGAIVGGAISLGSSMSSKVEGAEVTPAVAIFDKDGSGVLTAKEREAALKLWTEVYAQTEELWLANTPGDRYKLTPGKSSLLELESQHIAVMQHKGPERCTKGKGSIENRAQDMDRIQELVQAVESQAKFHERILKVGALLRSFAHPFAQRAYLPPAAWATGGE